MGSQVSANHNIYTRFSVANCLINCSQSHPPAPARVFVVPCPTTGPPGKETGGSSGTDSAEAAVGQW